MKMIGHVTSTYWSPTLQRSIAMALIENGQNRMGENLSFPLENKVVKAEIVDPVFYDKEGAAECLNSNFESRVGIQIKP